MRCISPLKAGFNKAGDIVYSSTKMDPELSSFEFVCRKCLPCRLNIAREKAIRAIHEAKCHENNIFLTLTYDEEHLESPKLIYRHFQLFMKGLREKITRGIKDKDVINSLYIPYMVTGEYGEINKRPHWHAILFNYRPPDAKYKYTTDLDQQVFTSEKIDKLWKRGMAEFGTVTLDSAGYVARYAAKKLVHGKDQEHDFHPIHKTCQKRAMGRTWIEKNWEHTFNHGFVVLPNGEKAGIPRYYKDWLKKYKLDDYIDYVNNARKSTIAAAEASTRKEELDFHAQLLNYRGDKGTYPRTTAQLELAVLKSKFKQLQENLKL